MSCKVLDILVSAVVDENGLSVGVRLRSVTATFSHPARAGGSSGTGRAETAYEELQSTNEELETTNEELQSSIEEFG